MHILLEMEPTHSKPYPLVGPTLASFTHSSGESGLGTRLVPHINFVAMEMMNICGIFDSPLNSTTGTVLKCSVLS